MRAALPALLLLSLLSACRPQEVRPPDAYALSGTIAGDWGAAPRLRLALVGTGVPVAVTNTSAIGQNVVSSGPNTWQFGFDLPGIPAVTGVYQVIAFDDANNNARYDVGETFARNRQWLVYSPVSGTVDTVEIPEFLGGGELLPAMTVTRGWNLYDRSVALGAGNPSPFTRLTSYTLSR
ncbi:hypothetical protein GO986_04040 [Deinococcus sp. HMF7620]|uniref:Lipoprotein n=1 Tax=Deinococcus arboris TaxID=2682977 RepID=A0A7C9HQ63_9DEIO|nr:hypothetical protein [Deinococcus arboris]MVN85929.1 hypothetical protein [Deinococcus arboris]